MTFNFKRVTEAEARDQYVIISGRFQTRKISDADGFIEYGQICDAESIPRKTVSEVEDVQ